MDTNERARLITFLTVGILRLQVLVLHLEKEPSSSNDIFFAPDIHFDLNTMKLSPFKSETPPSFFLSRQKIRRVTTVTITASIIFITIVHVGDRRDHRKLESI